MSTSSSPIIIRVAVPSPLRRHFDYLPPDNIDPHTIANTLQFGSRVLVPFGTRKVIGFVLEIATTTDFAVDKLKNILQILDDQPLWPPSILELLKWMSNYYHYPLGEVFHQVLPPTLRKTKTPKRKTTKAQKQNTEQTNSIIPNAGNASATHASINASINANASIDTNARGFELNAKQQHAIDAILGAANAQRFQPFLIDGVTGSGKTEIYLSAIAELLKRGKQALILVPEINLTPQTVERFTKRFPGTPIAIIHSQLSAKERFNAWDAAKTGAAKMVIGTRSAIFTPLRTPGIIIIDEEHDLSFKQQANLRYSARDLAMMRGKLESIPVVLGSATPSLESFANANKQRYTNLPLPERAGKALHPQFRIVDMRNQKIRDGLAEGLIQAIEQHLEKDGQVLLFLNNRGYAPLLLCNSCGWIADCKHCDAHLTLHRKTQKLHCHHCGTVYDIMQTCGSCKKPSLYALGLGTEKLESLAPKLFPGATAVRIDSDTTSSKGSINKMLAAIHSGESQILIGTQMLAKGHHFPNVTMVAILNVDNGLFSADFRASEHLAQLIMQVAGRAGRAERPGEVYIQTHHPHHPLLQRLVQHGYHSFARAALAEREESALPPFSYLALFRAEARNKERAMEFLQKVKNEGLRLAAGTNMGVGMGMAAGMSTGKDMAAGMSANTGVSMAVGMGNKANIKILGPATAHMERKAGFYNAQLLLQSSSRAALQHYLAQLVKYIGDNKVGNNVRWSLDVDPVEMV
jgi:primosomal protein N' (replication factor Y) (superfamily II helicase)